MNNTQDAAGQVLGAAHGSARRVFHVVGFTQYMGTCKFHIFRDCPQLQKKRVAHMAWGERVSTGAIYEAEYEIYNPDRQLCKLCRRRENKQNTQDEKSPPVKP